MTDRERQGWIIVASLFVTLVFVFGSGYNTGGLFFPHLLKHFGWKRAQLSTLQGAALPLSAGLSAPLIGWLLDRVEARVVMVAGAIMTGVSFLIASRVDSFGPLFGAYVLLGVGIGASTLLPCALVIANWFGARRGLAMGLTFAGTSLGGAAMTMVGNVAIAHGGWRAGYVALAIPMFVVVVPLIIIVVRTRPPQAEGVTVAQASDALPGFELREAFRCRSFWMISAAQFFFAAIAAGTGLHLITYLSEVGYTATFAASMMSLIYVFAAFGKLGMGLLADRVSARIALALNFLAACVGMILIFGAARTAVLIPFVLIFGLSLGAPLVLIPMLVAESLGLKRFGSIGGIAGIFNTIGAFVGPVGAGKIYDMTGSYLPAFEVFVVMCLLGAAVTYSCRSFESEQARQPSAPLPATA
ncbi:MAG TPA: MFS transporter [Candidatus Binatus sp.]|nr:MFS transporter [Candidatus Binatus sp.]